MKIDKITQNYITRAAIVTVAILLIPFIGTNISSEWNWSMADFLIMGTLIFGFGMIFQAAVNKVKDHNSKIIVGIVIIGIFLYVWAEMAVGIFTNIGS